MNDFEETPATPQTEEPQGAAEGREEEKVLTLEELRALYGNGKQGGKSARGTDKFPSKWAFICALLGLLGCIALAVATISSYAFPITVIGDRRFSEENLDLFSFIGNRIDRIREMTDAMSDQDAEAVLGVFGYVQATLALAIAFIVLATSIVYPIIAAVRFSRRKDTVCTVLVGMMRWNFLAYIIYPFIVNTSGGEGDAFYSVGFAPGIGMDVGMALGLGILCAAAVCTGFAYREEWQTSKKTWGYAAIEAVFSTCGCGLMSILPLYSVIIYVFTSLLGSVGGAIASGSFSFSGLAFTVFNLLLLICALVGYRLLVAGAEKNWKALVCRSVFRRMQIPSPKRRRMGRAGRLLRPAILFALCLICAIVLGVPSIGLGWSIQIVPQSIALIALSVAASIACLVWETVLRRKERPQAEGSGSVAAIRSSLS